MKRSTKRVLVFALLITPALLGAAAFWYMPRLEVPRFDEFPEGEHIAYASGVIRDGGLRDPASGNLTLYLDNETNEWFLYFQEYEASRGRDAWFFLTHEADPDSRQAVDEGVRLSVPGRGPADVRGTFILPIPESVDPLSYAGVVVWDLRFDERHAVAPLEFFDPGPPTNETMDQQ